MIRLIIFDLDGPILDSLTRSKEGLSEGAKKISAIRGIKILPEPEAFTRCWGYPGLKTASSIFPRLATDELRIITDCWAKNELKKKIPLVRGAIKTLEYLKKRGIFTAILTSRSHNLKFHLADYPLDNLFEIIQSWQSPELKPEKIHHNHIFSSRHKPDPEVLNPILKWAEKQNIEKGEIILIDDTLVGLETARNGGLNFLGVCNGPLDSKEKWLKYGNLDAKCVISSIADLPAWLAEYGGM